jgi:protease PrsW
LTNKRRTLLLSAAVVIVALVIAMVMLVGCGSPSGGERVPGIFASALAGTDDVELTYEIDGALSSTPIRTAFGEDLRALSLRRLSAGQIGADVLEDAKDHDRRVRITVDEALAPHVDELITWTGTLLVLDPDPDFVLPAKGSENSGVILKTDGPEKFYEGTRADILRTIETLTVDKEHRVVAEPIWSTASGRNPPKWRTRVVRMIPVGELGDGALIGWADGAMLRVRGVKGTLSAAVIHDARTRRAPPIVARGRISLGLPKYDGEDALLLSFGSGTEAYARAQHERRLLTTPRLPPLRRVGAIGLPPNRMLAFACLIVPVLLSLAWLGFVRRFDRAHPEPMWLVAFTFLLGAISTVPAGFLELILANASPWLDPGLVTFGGQTFALPLAFVVYTIVVGISEEGSKRVAAHFAVRRPEFDEPVDGIVYGIVASLGFAAAENIRYFAIGRMNAPLVIARCFMSVPAHMFFGAVWGYALGAKLVDPRKRTWAWLLLAAAAHGLFDALLSTEGAGMLAIILNVGLASVFVILVRRTLRHGVVTKEMLNIKPEDRVLFRVGRPSLFWVSAVFLHILALGIFFLGAYYQLARHRPSATFVIGSSVMLGLLAIAALGISQTVPLDVAIDDYGVTFAGAARPWRKIRGYEVHKDRVTLECEAGPILLGPAPHDVVEAIATELKRRLGSKGGHDRLLTLESG